MVVGAHGGGAWEVIRRVTRGVGGTGVSGISRSMSWCKKVRWPENFPAKVAGFCWCSGEFGGWIFKRERERVE